MYKSTFWPYSRKKIVCNTGKTSILLVWLLPSLCSGIKLHTRKINFFFPSCTMYYYVPLVRKLVFSLQLTVAQCSTLRYRGMKCKNWTAHAPIAMQRSTVFFFFVQRYYLTGKALYIWTAHASIKIHYYYTRSIKSKWPWLVVIYQV